MCESVSISAAIASALSIAGEAAASVGTAATALTSMSAGTALALSTGMSAVTGIAGAVGQMETYNSNKKAAIADMQSKDTAAAEATLQSEDASAVNAQNSQIAALKAKSTAVTSAGEAGVTGNSVDALISDYNASEGRYLSGLNQQDQFNREQLRLQQKGFAAQAQSQINSVQAPDFLGQRCGLAGTIRTITTAMCAIRKGAIDGEESPRPLRRICSLTRKRGGDGRNIRECIARDGCEAVLRRWRVPLHIDGDNHAAN